MAAFLLALALAPLLALSAERPEDYAPGVLATGPQGATNPAFPIMPTTIDQNSMARLLSINSIDDWCIFAPPWPATIPDTEDIEVAWCIQPRNNARVIPDGTVHGVTFLRTPYYVQVMGFGDFTRINILPNDAGGELDPYGALELGNPKGGNVSTTQINGRDVPLQEWMMFINWEFFCLRVCTNSNATYSTARMCWHELDIMGCEFVMPGQYNFQGGIFESCDADSAYPPGVYPIPNPDGSTSYSTFAQYFTGVYTGADGQPTGYTVGDTVTPAGPRDDAALVQLRDAGDNREWARAGVGGAWGARDSAPAGVHVVVDDVCEWGADGDYASGVCGGGG
ncbi:hypothetical protein MKEN_00407600 [Mycena kentingensis (nom. inval.)]|nr:hypothetical protein MKEN_00407600 [Mycena kentingensis (nom. inval.)]